MQRCSGTIAIKQFANCKTRITRNKTKLDRVQSRLVMYQNLGFESGSGRETAAVREQMCCVVIDPTGQRVLRLVGRYIRRGSPHLSDRVYRVHGQWKASPTFVLYRMKHTHTHTHIHLTALCPGLPGWAGTRKVKPIWILLKQETVSGSGISWAVCKSAPRSRPITTPAPHHLFTGRRPSCRPTNSVKALKNVSWQEIYREKDIFRKDGHFSETDRFVKPRVHFIGFQNQRWSYVPKYSVLRSIITEVQNITQRIE